MGVSSQTRVKVPTPMAITKENPLGILGFEFMEFAANPKLGGEKKISEIFAKFGLGLVARHRRKNVFLYGSKDIHFIMNAEPGSYAAHFAKMHGNSVVALGLRVGDARLALEEALKRGAHEFKGSDVGPMEMSIPAIYGVGDSLIYFIDRKGTDPVSIYDIDFIREDGKQPEGVGLLKLDHLTNNVHAGAMDEWMEFYSKIFGFTEIRYFDIRGKSGTGLLSRALLSPCKTFAIPINEPTDKKSQIQEYLDEYKGEGVQHIALTTEDIVDTVRKLRKAGIEFLDTPDTYYELLPKRLPHLKESIKELKELRILADGDEKGYLLQIFTKNLMGPIFVEIIQREGHKGFGEGNFQALFDSIELDQKRRGVI